MKKQARAAFNELKKIGCPVIDRQEDGSYFVISGESNCEDEENPVIWADYYNESLGYDFGVNPIVNDILAKHSLFCEWANPGMLNVWDD